MKRTQASILGLAALVAASLAVMGSGCADKKASAQSKTYVQVERLARPAINEGLFLTNDLLNTVNSIAPKDEPGALAGPAGAEATATLDALDSADGLDNVDAGGIVGALIPDVMRIDTTVASPVGTAAYANSLNALGAPVAGRKLEDDAIDVTLTLLVGSPVGDNVPYHRPTSGAGSSNGAIGHKLLNGQASAFGPATFPFLAPPN